MKGIKPFQSFNNESKVRTLPRPGQPAVIDDAGMWWVMNKDTGRIRVIGDNSKEGGYPCSSIEEAAEVLRILGYIE
jgi:hypothetical protein